QRNSSACSDATARDRCARYSPPRDTCRADARGRHVYQDRVIHVVVPAYNEASHIGRVIGTMPPLVDRVIVVDDGSTDGTAQAAEAYGDPRVTVLRSQRNLGVGGAMVLGYRHALQAGANIVVKMDGDGQMPPDALPVLLDAIVERGADYAKGNRF